jgi:hypothetical protein
MTGIHELLFISMRAALHSRATADEDGHYCFAVAL